MSSLTSNLYQFGEFRLDPQNRVLTKRGTTVPLTPKAFEVLLLLIQKAGGVVTKDELMKAVWPNSFVEESNLTQTVFMIRKALDESGGRRYILNVQGQGYRFLVPVTETATEAEIETPVLVSSAASAPEIPLQSQPHVNRRRLAATATLVAAVVLIAGATTWLWRSQHRPAQQQGKIMLAVLPFENFTGDAGQEYFSDGLTEEMISQLGNLDPASLGVIARTSVMHYKHTVKSIPEIGKDLGVQYVIEGSVRRDSTQVRITAQLIQVKDQSHLWAREYDRDLSHLLELQEEIAREVANEIEFSLSGRRPIEPAPERGALATKARANSYEVYDLCLKGRYCWNKRTGQGFRQAAAYFQQAIDKDPNYGPAYAGLADTFGLMSTWYVGPQKELMPKARTAALRALELDDSLAEAHASLALIKENYDYDWLGAEREFRRAIQLNPQYATAHQWYAESLSWQGRFQEALAESEQARRLDPLSPIIGSDHASILYYSRQYDAALEQIRSVLELDPSFEHAQDEMVPSYLQLGRYDEAIDTINHWPERGRERLWAWAWKAAAYGRAGRTEEARRALAKLEQVSPSRPGLAAMLLVAYSGTGQKERVIELLEEAYSERSNLVMQIKVEPMFDQMRSDPRFEDLLRHVGLQQ